MTTMAPDTVDESLDPRDPLLRLSTFFDEGTVELLHERTPFFADVGSGVGIDQSAAPSHFAVQWRTSPGPAS